MNEREHWEHIYSIRPAEKLGWYEPQLQLSLRWIKELGLAMDAQIIDVGGGVSTLVEDLLNEGYRDVTVLDISDTALSLVKGRLGDMANQVAWIEGDITSIDLPANDYDVWHDRAVFHFLTDPEQRQKYLNNLLNGLKPGGHLIIGTFAKEAPPMCSGLPVQRYSLAQLESTIGEQFELQQHQKELHITPGGVEQMYLYCRFRRLA